MTPMAAWRECGRAGAYTVTRDTPTSPCRPRDAFRPATSNSPDRYRSTMYTVEELAPLAPLEEALYRADAMRITREVLYK